jgi:hypothetical protein
MSVLLSSSSARTLCLTPLTILKYRSPQMDTASCSKILTVPRLFFNNYLCDSCTSLDLLCISSTPRRAPASTCIQSCLPDFSLPISSHPAARCRTWIIPRCAFEATRGRGGAPALRRGRRAAARSGGHCRLISTRMACSPVRRIRPSRISTARRGVRGGTFAL